MEVIKDFDIEGIPRHKILFVATTAPDYEEDRTIIVEAYPDWSDFTVIHGSHCSCYDWDDVSWEAVKYDQKELIKLAEGWKESGWGSDLLIAPLILSHFRSYRSAVET